MHSCGRVPTLMSCTTCACRRSASSAASRWKPLDEAVDSKNFFTATFCPACSASYTAPNEPAPIHLGSGAPSRQNHSRERSISAAGSRAPAPPPPSTTFAASAPAARRRRPPPAPRLSENASEALDRSDSDGSTFGGDGGRPRRAANCSRMGAQPSAPGSAVKAASGLATI